MFHEGNPFISLMFSAINHIFSYEVKKKKKKDFVRITEVGLEISGACFFFVIKYALGFF